MDEKTPKELFKQLLRKITRDGIENLAAFLDQSDFYSAPCSTKFHLCVPGGLVMHSLNVYSRLASLNREFDLGFDSETMLVCGLFHDICKANFYGTEKKWRKDARNQWESYEAYVIKDQFPMGHGEKSVAVLQQFIYLTPEEMLAIRWHMSAFTDGFNDYGTKQAYNAATKLTPLVPALFMADYEATHFMEKDELV